MSASDSLQLALDEVELAPALRTLTHLGERVRRVEVGTPLLLSAGMSAVRAVRSQLGDGVVVADTKICDAGERIARSAFSAGADVVTVVGAAIDSRTWDGVLAAARDSGDRARVMVDAIGWTVERTRLADWLAAASVLGIDVELCAHRGRTAFAGEFDDLLASLRPDDGDTASRPDPIHLVAGSLTTEDVPAALAAGFDLLIVGSAIAASIDPTLSWDAFARAIDDARSAQPTTPEHH